MAELIQRPQRGEVVGEIGMDQLPHPFGTAQVAQAVHTEITDGGVGGEMIGHQAGGDVRQQHLAPMGTGPQPGAADHRMTDVVVCVAQLRFAGVHRHAHQHARHLARQGPLHIHGRGDGIRRP